jgi:tetratricopeptide (TPR) repeat protein
MASAQGIAAWDFEKDGDLSGNSRLGGLATNSGVGNPLGFKESTPPVTGYAPAAYDPKIEYAKGYTDLNLGRFGQAEQDFKNALSVEPRNPKTLFMLGEALIGQGDLSGAVDAFEKAVKYDPQQIIIRTEYAVALAKLGRTDKAGAQLAVIKARADSCHEGCAQASDYKAALDRVQAAMAGGVKQSS